MFCSSSQPRIPQKTCLLLHLQCWDYRHEPLNVARDDMHVKSGRKGALLVLLAKSKRLLVSCINRCSERAFGRWRVWLMIVLSQVIPSFFGTPNPYSMQYTQSYMQLNADTLYIQWPPDTNSRLFMQMWSNQFYVMKITIMEIIS